MIHYWIKSLFCKHYKVKFWRNIYGDEINALNCRSVWECTNCMKIIKSPYLQGAVDWLLLADGEYFAVATVKRTLRIGYNRASRLAEIAKHRAAATKERT